jgi:hypothetical protein
MPALPPVIKTWQHSHVAGAGFGSGNTSQNIAQMLRSIKDQFKAMPLGGFGGGSPVVLGSVEGTGGTGGMDGVDRWTSNTPVGITQTTYQPWIVLQFADGSQLLISGRGASTSAGTAGNHFYYSPSAGFTFTVNTARPTATDERSIGGSSSAATGIITTAGQHVYHVWLSTDGKEFRIAVMYNGQCTFLCGVTNPIVKKTGVGPCTFFWSVTGTMTKIDPIATATAGNGGIIYVREGSTWYASQWTVPGTIGANLQAAGQMLPDFIAQVNPRDSSWPIFKIGIASDTVGAYGTQGVVVDLWMTASIRNTGDGFPKITDGLGAEDQFAVLSPFVLPNPSGLVLQVS